MLHGTVSDPAPYLTANDKALAQAVCYCLLPTASMVTVASLFHAKAAMRRLRFPFDLSAIKYPPYTTCDT